MALFGQKKSQKKEPVQRAAAVAPAAEPSTESGEDRGTEAEAAQQYDRAAQGPFDLSEVESTEGYVDLGGLRIPRLEGMNIRIDVDQEHQSVVAVTLSKENSAVQIQAFAAPKSRTLWPEIRVELASSVRQQDGIADIEVGPFGKQVVAKIPAELPNGGRGYRVARFVGIDGPRWYVRAVFSGDAAVHQSAAQEMEEAFRQVVVVRGKDPMAPRDLLPLKVPEGAVRRQEAPEDRRENLPVPERGPEITQIG